MKKAVNNVGKACGEEMALSTDATGVQGRLLQDLVSRIPDAIYYIDTESGKYTYVSPAFQRLTGYTLDEANGMGGYAAFTELSWYSTPVDKRAPDGADSVVGGGADTVERWMRRKDGAVVCLADRSTPFVEGNKIRAVCGVLRDITERKEQEFSLYKSYVLLRTVIENLPDAVYAKDRQGKKTYANPADLKNLGCRSIEDVLDKDDFAVLPRELAQQSYDDDKKVLTTGEPLLNREELIQDCNGQKRWLLTNKIPIRNADGEINGLVGTSHDITNRKRSLEALRLFRALIDRSSDCIEVFDPNTWMMVDANETTLKTLGYTREELLSLSLDVLDPDAARNMASVHKAMQENGTVLLRRRQKRKDGSFLPVELHLSLVQLDKEFVVAVVRDITARQAVEASLKESEERFRLISENVVDLMAVLDESGVCLYASPSHTNDRLRPEALVGKNYLSNIHPDDLPEVRDRMERVASGRGHQSIQFRFRDGDGAWRFKDTSITLLVDDAGSRLLTVARDITDRIAHEEKRRALEQEVNDRNAELEKTLADIRNMQQGLIQSEKMASIGQLTAGIAHEINNPLAFVSSNLNRFKEYFESILGIIRSWDQAKGELKKEPRFNELLQKMEHLEDAADLDFVVEDFDTLMKHTADGTERIRSIVDRLRGFSHMATSSLEKADLNAAIDDTVNLTWNELKYKATIVKEYGDIPQVTCNIGEVKQVLVNLLVNAAHALQDKGTITLRTFRSDDQVVVEVKDSGVGISEANKKRIFDPFFTTKPVGKGTGLGLWISATIIQKHNGTLSVDSEPGRGTTMSVMLPIEQLAEPEKKV
jgi:two-component system, NtrC family, sensor kinase